MFPKIRYILHEDKQPVRFEIDLESEGMENCVIEYEKFKSEQNGVVREAWIARVRGFEAIIHPTVYEMETKNAPIQRIAERGLQNLYMAMKELQSAFAELDVLFTDVLSPTLNIKEQTTEEKKSFIKSMNKLFS